MNITRKQADHIISLITDNLYDVDCGVRGCESPLPQCQSMYRRCLEVINEVNAMVRHEPENDLERLIMRMTDEVWPGMDWLYIRAVVNAESSFMPDAVSPVGAVGLMQLMPDTAREVGLRVEPENGIDWRLDSERNLRGGIQYLKKMHIQFTSPRKPLERMKWASGAYNAGLGNILKAQKLVAEAGENVLLWRCLARKLPDITGDHAKETIGYVEKITDEFQRTGGNLSGRIY